MAHDPSSSASPQMFPSVPGFEFLQGLVKKNAGPGMPGLGQWVAPTLDPEEVEKRIQELKAVQFWLEQNARMLGATIQALEVQRMTLTTLKTMNVRMTDLRDALTVRAPEGDASKPASGAAQKRGGSAPAPAPEPPKPMGMFQMPSMFSPASREPASRPAEPAPKAQPPAPAPAPAAAAAGTEPAAGGAVDAMQWWTALTQQFADLASTAMRDGAEATQKLAAMMPGGTGDPAEAEAAAAAQEAAAGGQAAAAPAPGGASAKTPAQGRGAPMSEALPAPAAARARSRAARKRR